MTIFIFSEDDGRYDVILCLSYEWKIENLEKIPRYFEFPKKSIDGQIRLNVKPINSQQIISKGDCVYKAIIHLSP